MQKRFHPHTTEVTVINRQSYMAEISSLLGLITDDATRVALIEKMERMFDAAPDEERLIQEIGNPTKVAVALIRYADSGKITPAAAPVVAPETIQPPRPQQTIDESQYRPAADVILDAAPLEEAPDGLADFEDLYPEDADEAPVDPSGAPVEAADEGEYGDGYDEYEAYADGGAASDEADVPFDEAPEDGAEYAGGEEDESAYADEDNPFTEMFDDLGAETVTKTNVPLAILYTIGAIIVGVPVFAALLVMNLALLALGVAALAAGVALIGTAFIGLSVVADMLILLGGGASVFALALVLVWLAIWFFLQVTLGWIRALVALGRRWCCKEVEVA